MFVLIYLSQQNELNFVNVKMVSYWEKKPQQNKKNKPLPPTKTKNFLRCLIYKGDSKVLQLFGICWFVAHVSREKKLYKPL